MGIGQGDLLVTPMQMALVASVIANRGGLVPPRMVANTGEAKGQGGGQAIAQAARQIGAEFLSSEDWEKMVRSMEDVVHRGDQGFRGNGTAWAYIGRDIEYRMAGKSGTAQVVEIRQGEEYEENELSEFDRKHAWFIAFAPVDKPTIALAVLVENGGGGSSVAAPVARAVVDAHMSLQLSRGGSLQGLEVARR